MNIIHFFPRIPCGMELNICFSSCYMYITDRLLIDFTFVNTLCLCNSCLFTQAGVEVAMGKESQG